MGFLEKRLVLELLWIICLMLQSTENNVKITQFSLYLARLTGTRIPDPPFSSFGPSHDYGMDLYLEVYL